MPGTILVKDAIYRASVLLQDVDPQYLAHPEAELVDWFNDGQLALTTFVPSMCSRIDSIKLRAGTLQSIATIAATDYKPLDGSTPSLPVQGKQVLYPVCTMGTNGTTPGKAVRMGNRKQMDATSPDWHSATGEVRQIFYDPTTPTEFFVSKGVPGDALVWLRLAYVADPFRIPAGGAPGSPIYNKAGTSTLKLSVNDECLEPLLHYVCARANMKESPASSPQDAVMYASLFTAWVNAKVTSLTGKNPNLKRLPMAPEPLAAAS